MRQKGRYLLKAKGQSSFQRLDNLVGKPGQKVWLEDCQLTVKHLAEMLITQREALRQAGYKAMKTTYARPVLGGRYVKVFENIMSKEKEKGV